MEPRSRLVALQLRPLDAVFQSYGKKLDYHVLATWKAEITPYHPATGLLHGA